jgi:hypothetical protein
MTDLDPLIGPVAGLIDQLVADPTAREAAQLRLLRQDGPDGAAIRRSLARITAGAAADPWTRGARPAFLYVMYVLLLCALPVGILAAVRPALAGAVARGVGAYLAAIPEPLYALFGTGYLGYTVARSWGKARGVER